MMNPFQGHQIYTDPTHLSRERSSDRDYRRYSRYPGQDRSSIGADVGWDKPSRPSQTWHNEEKHYDDKDPDGQPYEPDEEDDPELARKRKELQVIEEQIMLKRASIALKNVDFKMILPISGSEESSKTSEILRDRVNRILQLRHGPKGPLVKMRKQSSLSLQDDHPLKQRVKSVLQQRFEDHSTKAERYEQIPFLCTSPSPPPSPCQNHTSPPKDESNADQGFIRFLNILNKGVDIDQLSKIVNDDCEVPSSKFMPHSSHQNGDQFDLSSSVSPPSMNTKEEEERLNTDEQHKHLQNVLESLGLSLGMDEMSRLADRTQKRLYGRRQFTKETTEEEKLEENKTEEDKTTMEKGVQPQDGGEIYSPGHYTRSSSSSSSSLSASRKRSRSRSYRSPKSKSYRSRSRSPKSRSFRSRSRSPRSWSFRSRSPKSRSFRSRSRSPRSRSFRSRSRSPKSRSFRSRSRSYSRSPSQHRRRSRTRNHRDLYLQNQASPPSHPAYSYDYSSSTGLHHQIYPPSQAEAYSALYNNYLQYTSYYNYQSEPSNYWANYHPSVSASNNINVPLTSVNRHNSLRGYPAVGPTNRIPPLMERPWVMGPQYIQKERTQEEKEIQRAYNKHAIQEIKFNRKKKKELQAIMSLIKQPNQPEKQTEQASNEQASSNAQASQAQASGQTASNAVPKKKNKKKKKKVRVFVEDADRPERTEGPLTRCFVAKNPEKFSEFDGRLVVIEDVVVPLFMPLPSQPVVTDSRQNRRNLCRGRRHLVDLLSQHASRIDGKTIEQKQTDKLLEQCVVENTETAERTESLIATAEPGEQQKVQVKEETQEKPVLTEEEIKANLKKKLEAFNNRIKQPFKSTANSLMPQTNVEDEI